MNEGVLIHDPGNAVSVNRAKTIAERFHVHANELFFTDLDDEQETENELAVIKRLDKEQREPKTGVISLHKMPKIRLILRHNSKKESMPAVPCSCVIRYSTESGNCTQGTKYWIYRGIKNLPNYPTENEARKLWEWAEHCNPDEMPEILLPPIKINILYALTILCQGYLAVHAEMENGVWGPAGILEALELMGWIDLMESGKKSFVPMKLKKKKKEVREAKWWIKPLGVIDENGKFGPNDSKINDKEWDKFENNLKRELGKTGEGLPMKLSKLLCKLRKGKNISKPSIVADAYLELYENLGGNRD